MGTLMNGTIGMGINRPKGPHNETGRYRFIGKFMVAGQLGAINLILCEGILILPPPFRMY